MAFHILVLSVSAGAGHVRAAEAICSAARASQPTLRATHLAIERLNTRKLDAEIARPAMKSLAAILLAAALCGPLAAQTVPAPAASGTAVQAAPVRDARWAVPVTLAGVPNLHRISPSLYRSEQPTALGMKNLEQLGIRTVINLRFFNNDRKEVAGTLLRTERVKILTWDIDDDQVVEVMRILRNPQNGPYLIHCQHGADRTGLISAMYRILEEGWSVDDALAELTGGGYGYHSIWSNILRYVRSADIEKLRAEIGAPYQSTGSTSTVTAN